MPDEHGDRLNDDHLRAIGRITVNFSYLEAVLGLLIWIHTGIEKQKVGQFLTTPLSFPKRLKVLEAFVREFSFTQENLDTLAALMKDANEINDRRNQLIHSTWVGGDTTEKAVRTKSVLSKGYRFNAEELTVDELDAFADRMTKLSADFIKFSWQTFP